MRGKRVESIQGILCCKHSLRDFLHLDPQDFVALFCSSAPQLPVPWWILLRGRSKMEGRSDICNVMTNAQSPVHISKSWVTTSRLAPPAPAEPLGCSLIIMLLSRALLKWPSCQCLFFKEGQLQEQMVVSVEVRTPTLQKHTQPSPPWTPRPRLHPPRLSRAVFFSSTRKFSR